MAVLSPRKFLRKCRKTARRIWYFGADVCFGLPRGACFDLERLPVGRSYQRSSRPDRLIFAPRRDVARMVVIFPVDWDADPHQDRNWRAQLHMWRAIDGHLIAFARCKDLVWLELPVTLMLDWWQWHLGSEGGARASRYSWTDQINGIRSTKLAYILSVDRERRFLTRLQRHRLLELARVHVQQIAKIVTPRYSNHMFDDLLGLAALRTQLGTRAAAKITAFIERELPKLLGLQFTRNGVHCENSPGYQYFTNYKLRELIQTGWFEMPELTSLLAKGEVVERWLRMPDGSFAPVGDSDGRISGPPVESPDTPIGLFNRDGYIVHRDAPALQRPPSSFFLHMAAYHSPTHKHDDDLSYIWYDNEDIICDVGKYAYKDDVWAQYAKSPQAHNTIQIDDAPFRSGTVRERRELGTYGSAVRHVREIEQYLVISSAVHHVALGIDHVRTLVFRPGRFVLCVDRVADCDPEGLHAERPPRLLTQWTHFAPAIRLRAEGPLQHVGALQDQRQLAVGHATAACQFTTELVRGVEQPVIQGWISEAYRKMTPADVLAARQLHKGVSLIASVVAIGRRELPIAIRTDTADGIDRVILSPAGRNLVVTPDDGTREPRLRIGPRQRRTSG
ncbi:MAG: heparinase II/III family protein [Novosphingobium sp.]